MNIETAGARLKKIRQEKGLSLEEMQKKTKIHLNVLRAIEGDSVLDLSPIYLKGFIKIYCSCLGLEVKDYIGPVATPVKPVLNATVGRPIGARIEKKAAFIKDAAIKLGESNHLLMIKKIAIFAVLALIVIFLGVNFIKFMVRGKKTPLERTKILMSKAVPVTKSISATQTKINKDLAGGFTVGVFARDKSWITAKADGKIVFHGALGRGRSQTWHAKEKIELSLGDAGAVELQVNDQRFTNLARRGKPLKNILINKEGLKISR
ncbi:MAG: RodZ domain-containing protein [Candidatus Omnitrophota bacterium]